MNEEKCFNPDRLPVERLIIVIKNDGIVQQVNALDTYWVEKSELVMYQHPPPSRNSILGATDAWKAKMELYLQQLEWLLKLEHHRFWSTILYHPRCMDMLVSYLQNANPPYLPSYDCKDVQTLYSDIRRLVLIVFSRLITNKESEKCWMSKEFMSKIIYDKFIFTIPIIWDLCLVYGADNRHHVSRLVESVFTLQPRYEVDTAAALGFVKETFKFIILQVKKDYDSDEPLNLPETFSGFGDIKRPPEKKLDNITLDILRDLVVHMLDTAMTLRIFLEVYPKIVKIFREINFVVSIVQLYEYGIPNLYEKLQEVCDESSSDYAEVEQYLEIARAELIDIFREMLAVYKNAILNDEVNKAKYVEDYLSVMMDGLSERLLIRDYQACYPVHEDLEMLRQVYPEIDTVKTDFILQAIYSNLEEPVRDILTNGNITNTIQTTDNVEVISNGVSDEVPNDICQQSMISEVNDILPHLGDGFILKCLQHFNFSAERVISCILEDSLPEALKGLDRTMPIIPDDPLDKKFLETGIQRLNIFDGDEFDIMSRDDVDLSRIHVGKKKSKYKDLKDMLQDNEVVRQRADIYSKYDLVCSEAGMYSDEYDDTYDSDGAARAGDDDHDDARRLLVTPRVLRDPAPRAEQSDDETDEENDAEPGTSSSRLDFCVNPEVLRAKREASYQAKRGKGHVPPQPRNKDVIGKPRGQGQEKEVIANRDKKEKNKSSRSNHNRKQGAQWKKSRGMIPS